MDYYDDYDERRNCDAQRDELRNEFDEWFTVSGDMDDFIFYGENDRSHSEK